MVTEEREIAKEAPSGAIVYNHKQMYSVFRNGMNVSSRSNCHLFNDDEIKHYFSSFKNTMHLDNEVSCVCDDLGFTFDSVLGEGRVRLAIYGIDRKTIYVWHEFLPYPTAYDVDDLITSLRDNTHNKNRKVNVVTTPYSKRTSFELFGYVFTFYKNINTNPTYMESMRDTRTGDTWTVAHYLH